MIDSVSQSIEWKEQLNGDCRRDVRLHDRCDVKPSDQRRKTRSGQSCRSPAVAGRRRWVGPTSTERRSHFTKVVGVGCPLDERAAVVGN
jgi:hypothetical protein